MPLSTKVVLASPTETNNDEVSMPPTDLALYQLPTPNKTQTNLPSNVTDATHIVTPLIQQLVSADEEAAKKKNDDTPATKSSPTAGMSPKQIRAALAKSTAQQTKWDMMLAQLREFKAEMGNCLVPNRYTKNPQLGSWVSTQRRQYKLLNAGLDTPLTHERAKILEDVGFVWATRDPRHVPWEHRFQELCKYKEVHGHCLVPISFKSNVQLSNWVSTQRQEYKLMKDGRPSRLTEERIKKLNNVGFVWEAQRGGSRRKRSRKMDSCDVHWDERVLPGTNKAQRRQGVGSTALMSSSPRAGSFTAGTPAPSAVLSEDTRTAPDDRQNSFTSVPDAGPLSSSSSLSSFSSQGFGSQSMLPSAVVPSTLSSSTVPTLYNSPSHQVPKIEEVVSGKINKDSSNVSNKRNSKTINSLPAAACSSSTIKPNPAFSSSVSISSLVEAPPVAPQQKVPSSSFLNTGMSSQGPAFVPHSKTNTTSTAATTKQATTKQDSVNSNDDIFDDAEDDDCPFTTDIFKVNSALTPPECDASTEKKSTEVKLEDEKEKNGRDTPSCDTAPPATSSFHGAEIDGNKSKESKGDDKGGVSPQSSSSKENSEGKGNIKEGKENDEETKENSKDKSCEKTPSHSKEQEQTHNKDTPPTSPPAHTTDQSKDVDEPKKKNNSALVSPSPSSCSKPEQSDSTSSSAVTSATTESGTTSVTTYKEKEESETNEAAVALLSWGSAEESATATSNAALKKETPE